MTKKKERADTDKFVRFPSGKYMPLDLMKFYGTDTLFPEDKKKKKGVKQTKAAKGKGK